MQPCLLALWSDRPTQWKIQYMPCVWMKAAQRNLLCDGERIAKLSTEQKIIVIPCLFVGEFTPHFA